MNTCQWLVAAILPVVSALMGIVLGSCLTAWRESVTRRHSFVERQLRELYSPLLGIKFEIEAYGQVRVKVTEAADAVHREGISRQPTPEDQMKFSQEHKTEYDKHIAYDNDQFRKKLFPAYKQMITAFRDNLWLAEPETRAFFPKLVEFVELWNRWLEDTLSSESASKVGPDESKLLPFYEHLEQVHDKLRSKMKQGNA